MLVYTNYLITVGYLIFTIGCAEGEFAQDRTSISETELTTSADSPEFTQEDVEAGEQAIADFEQSSYLAKPLSVPKGYRYEGVGFTMSKSGTPIYRLYNSKGQDHAYTSNPGKVGKWVKKKGYKLEGIAFYQQPGYAVPVHRLTKRIGSKTNNFYTASANEALKAHKGGYGYKGVAFKAKCLGACESTEDQSINIHRFYSGYAFNHFFSTTGL